MIQWVYKTWVWFWRTLLVLIALMLLIGGGVFGLLQLKPTQSYIASQIEEEFNESLKGTLHIERLDGLLPFRFQFAGVSIQGPKPYNSSRVDSAGNPVMTMDSVEVDLNLSSLLRRNLVIDRLDIKSPYLNLRRADSGAYTIVQAFEPVRSKINLEQQRFFDRLKVLAPYLNIHDGKVRINEWPRGGRGLGKFPEPFTANSINLASYVELTQQEKFIDIEHFNAVLSEFRPGSVSMRGQLFSKDSLLELNGFELRTPHSALNLTGSIEGFEWGKKDYQKQLRNARYTLDLDTTYIYLREWAGLSDRLPSLDQKIGIDADLRGDRHQLQINDGSFFMGESRLTINGMVNKLFLPSQTTYEGSMDTLNIRRTDLAALMPDSSLFHKSGWDRLTGKAQLAGSADTISSNFSLDAEPGLIEGRFRTSLKPPYNYETNMQVDSLNLSKWLPGSSVTHSVIKGKFVGEGMGISWDEAIWTLRGTLKESSINQVPLQAFIFELKFIEGFIEPSFTLDNRNNETIKGEGWIDLTQSPAKIQYGGYAKNLNLKRYLPEQLWPKTKLDADYKLDLTGSSISDLFGHMSLDVASSTIEGDSVAAHSFYADINNPASDNRMLRITSSLFDMEVNGNLSPKPLMSMYSHWQPYLDRVFRHRILMDSTGTDSDSVDTGSSPPSSDLGSLELTVDVDLKEVSLLNRYFDFMPSLISNSNMEANIKADARKMLMRGTMKDRKLKVGDLTYTNPGLQMTGNVSYGRPLEQFGSLNLEVDFKTMSYRDQIFKNYTGRFQLQNDSISYNHFVEQGDNGAEFNLKADGKIIENAVVSHIREFNLGNEQYTWHSVGIPEVTFRRSGNIIVKQFRFRSQEELLSVEGTYSPSLKDSVHYNFENIQLHRVSELIGGRVTFGGTMDGEFYTRALATQPSIEGNIDIDRVTISDRLIGDLNFRSRYRPEQKLFDTRIQIKTDSAKYPDYLQQNEGIGQDILLNGYLQPPEIGGSKEHLFKFNVDFREIDMWVIREIVPDIFDDVNGRAEGEGWITGSLSDYDFHADFEVDDVHANTMFLNTNYWLNGSIEFDKQEGLVFHEVQLSDQHGGSGQVVGRVDLNEFNPVKYFDLTLTLNRLQFLNNDLDQDTPFFGELYGSGQLHLSGNNQNPYLRTIEQVSVTENSELSIPLMEETELSEESRFIRFVDQFEKAASNSVSPENGRESKNGRVNGQQESVDKTFTELFRLDLQFEAPRNTTVRLIFDPVTGDVLTAQGTGQLNIRLEDGDVQMFGSYNINNGSYQFVSGDIFTRNFSLESGGQLTWQGDPENAELDVTAVYSARPSVNSLMGNRSSSNNAEQRRVQNLPVDLVLHITGALSAINNDFYFRLPNAMEISQNVAISNRINQLNRDDEQKLLQATSLLLTGEFIPVSGSGMSGGQAYLGDNLSGSSVVLNPLLSNQVFSPLLSNQINSLLNSDISSLDVDINLNAYNQVDLGIALRLYNNRLILRREGEVTGPQSDLGSLGATYRINRSLSVKAFHRQDLTLSNLTNTRTQVEYLNGAGVEARVQFNSWKSLTRQFFDKIKSLFTDNSKARRDDQTSPDREGWADITEDEP